VVKDADGQAGGQDPQHRQDQAETPAPAVEPISPSAISDDGPPMTNQPSGENTPGSEDAIPNLHLHSIWQDVTTGLGFFTRLPVGASTTSLSDAARVFSLIGALIGIGATLFYVFGLWIGLSSPMSAILAVAATAVVTGALHEDGLADFADMLGVRGDRPRKLAVMRDSTIGSYGTLALIFISLMKVAALMELAVPGQVAGALISAHALGRGVLPLIMRTYPLARSDGLAVHAGKPPVNGTYLALILGALIAGLVGGPGVALVATVSALAAGFLVAHLAHRQLGGYTGDVLGAAEQIIEVTVIMNFVSFT
jgi:adenosylcobinamide-GDP ribazoletransferase